MDHIVKCRDCGRKGYILKKVLNTLMVLSIGLFAENSQKIDSEKVKEFKVNNMYKIKEE